MPTVSESPEVEAARATLPRRNVTATCRRCSSTFSCMALEVGAALWPITFYCDGCYTAARAEHDAAEADAYRLKRSRSWDEDVGRDQFTDTDLERLEREAPGKKARVLQWSYEGSNGRGLVLYGESGKTKSRVMYILARRTYVDDGVMVHVARATALARKVSDFNATTGSVESLIRHLITVPVLFLDDLGKETQSERWESALVEILDARGAARRPCIITTNFVGERLAKRYRDDSAGEAVVRRVREFCAPIGFQ